MAKSEGRPVGTDGPQRSSDVGAPYKGRLEPGKVRPVLMCEYMGLIDPTGKLPITTGYRLGPKKKDFVQGNTRGCGCCLLPWGIHTRACYLPLVGDLLLMHR